MNTARDLTHRLAVLLRREQGAMAEFLVALAAFHQERRWLELGHASLFYFLHRELGLAKDSAFQRMTAAELILRYPEVVEPLRDGRLTLSTLSTVESPPLARGRMWSNVRIACRVHNVVAARRIYGDAWMDRYTRGGAKPSSDAHPPP